MISMVSPTVVVLMGKVGAMQTKCTRSRTFITVSPNQKAGEILNSDQ